jgi:hypothetical protein
MDKKTKFQLTSLAVVGAPLAAVPMDDAQAANGDFAALCGTTITEDTWVSDFSDALYSDCSIDFAGPYHLFVENGEVDFQGYYSLYVSSSYSSDIAFNNVDILGADNVELHTEGTCDQYGVCYGNVSFKGGKHGHSIDYALLEAESVELEAYGDILLKWANTDNDSDTYDLDIRSDGASVAVIGNLIGEPTAPDGCVVEFDVFAQDSMLIADNDLYLCDGTEHDWDVSGSYGELNVKGNYIDMVVEGNTHIEASVGSYGSINFSDNLFDASTADDTVDAYAPYGSVIWKKNDFDNASVDTHGTFVSCQDLRNDPTSEDPCISGE